MFNRKEKQVKTKYQGKKKIIITSILISVILAFAGSFAWYRFSREEHGDTREIEIMTPYFLYLMNPDDSTSLQFTVGNLHPGETKQIVICVSNKRPVDVVDYSIDIAKESEFAYDLEFVYTENLKVNYDIYELDKETYENVSDVPESGIFVDGIAGYYWNKKEYPDSVDPENNPKQVRKLVATRDASDERHLSVFGASDNGYTDILNKGKYLLYKKDGEGKDLALAYNTDYEYDYYLIEISWKDDVTFSEYTKESDLLYVIVNAKQPEPLANGD